jgi:hypothetical protein
VTQDDLIYAAYSRCSCGAGLAYKKNPGPDEMYWDCSAILLGTADRAVKHEAQLPFAFWSLKSELQPSVGGATTRPKGTE